MADPVACTCLQGGGGNLTFPAVALHRKAGEALPSLAPTTWCHVFALAPCATSWGACRQQVARPPAEMAFNYFLSRVALIKISTSNFLTRKVQAIGHSRGKLPVLLAGSALPRFPPAAAGEAPVPGRAMGSTARLLNFH